MPEFKYTAIDRSGQQASGKLDADSPDDARKKLMAKGLMVTALTGDAGDMPAWCWKRACASANSASPSS